MNYEDRARKYVGDNAALYERMARSLDVIIETAPQGRAIAIWIEVWVHILKDDALVRSFTEQFIGIVEEDKTKPKE